MPLRAFGSLEISEVMYDTAGSDSGREWIEIANLGDVSIDISGFKLSEGGVNHGITTVVGTSSLNVGEVAIIAANTQKFLADWPSYTGTLFKSSFSLSNVGETLVIKTKALEQVASATYSSDVGASGDGNSLHLRSASFIVGAPNPGSIALSAPLVVKAKTPAAPKNKTSNATKSKTTSSFTSDTPIVFEGEATGALPAPQEPTTLWITLSGLGALVVLGVAGALYVKHSQPSVETLPSAAEFEIE